MINQIGTDTVIDINKIPQNNNVPIHSTLIIDTPQNQVINMTQTNNWNDQNENTLRNWKTSLVQSIFIYQFILDKTQIRFNRILFSNEILGGISSLISTISATILSVNKGLNPATTYNNTSAQNITINSSPIDYIALALTICVAILSITVTIMTRIIKIYKLDTTIATFTAFISNMDYIYSSISVELTKPKYLRMDANVFINNMSSTYSDLIKNSPNIDIEDQEAAGIQYAKYIDGKTTNFNITQKYAYNDNNISVI
jgi:hypothetical protein